MRKGELRVILGARGLASRKKSKSIPLKFNLRASLC